jgi:hypothetical protein
MLPPFLKKLPPQLYSCHIVACGKEKPKAFFAFLVIEKWAISK